MTDVDSLQRFLVWLGQRVTIAPLVGLVSILTFVCAVSGVPRPALFFLLALQALVMVAGIRIHRPRPTDTGKKS